MNQLEITVYTICVFFYAVASVASLFGGNYGFLILFVSLGLLSLSSLMKAVKESN